MEIFEIYDVTTNTITIIADEELVSHKPYDNRYVFGSDIQDRIDSGEVTSIIQRKKTLNPKGPNP